MQPERYYEYLSRNFKIPAMPYHDLISVIVCTYNQQNTIGRTLDSILMQKCRLPLEVVIGDDSSTDGTRAICSKYQELHPDIVRLMPPAPNKGFVRNYFDCLRACRGKYIADCSGDDFWIDETKLEASAYILDTNPHVGIVHTDWQKYNEQTKKLISPGKPTINDQTLLIDILSPGQRPAIHLCTALYRNEWIRRAMQEHPQFFDPETYHCEDVQTCFFLARMGDVAYIDRPTLAYSWGGESLSNPQNEEKQFHFWANVTHLSFDLSQFFHITSPRFDCFLQARIHKLLMHAFRSGKPALRAEALNMQKEMHIADNQHIRFAKLLTMPGIWPVMRRIRDLIRVHPH